MKQAANRTAPVTDSPGEASTLARRWGAADWRAWGVSLLVIALLMLALDQGYRQLQSRAEAPLFRVVVNGQTLTLDADTHAAFSRDLGELAGGVDARLQREMQPWLDERLDAAFAPLEAAVPAYLDWYFSLRGSYLRLGMAIAGDLDGWLEARLTEQLVEKSGIEAALDELQAAFPEQLAQRQQALGGAIGQRLHERYAEQQASPSRDAESRTHSLDLDLTLNRAFHESQDSQRWGAAGVGGAAGAVAGRALAQRLAGGAAAQGARVALGRVATRLGDSATRSLASGATASAVAAPTGPGALLAGTAATVVSLAGFAGTEYALLKAEEARYRPAMEAELQAEVGQARDEVRQALEARTAASSAALLERLETGIRQAEAAEQVPDDYRIFGRLP
jgi:hypothetical protein